MNYLLDKKIKRNKYLKYTIFLVIIFILIYFQSSIFYGLSYVANGVFRPILVLKNNFGEKLSNFGSYFNSKKSLQIENENLKKTLAEISYKVSNYDALSTENINIKEILDRKNEKTEMVLAAILAKPNQSPYDTFIIDVGVENGITIGQRVFAFGNVPIGNIAEVYSNTSKVILYSNPGEKTEVVVSLDYKIFDDTVKNQDVLIDESQDILKPIVKQIGHDTFMQVVGRGGGNFEMSLPRDILLEEGKEVVLPGIIPYTLGIVQTIISDPRDSYQKALLISPVNIQELKFVEVEK